MQSQCIRQVEPAAEKVIQYEPAKRCQCEQRREYVIDSYCRQNFRLHGNSIARVYRINTIRQKCGYT